MPVWKARAIAALTHDLGQEAIAYADRMLAATPAKLRLVDAERLVDEARLYFDPDRAAADEEHELEQAWGVALPPWWPGHHARCS